MKSEFITDLRNEKRLAVFLDTLYPTLIPKYEVERVYDLERQHRGCDLILKKGELELIVDEKAQLNYINNDLPTFAFELSYLKNGDRHEGWLLDPRKRTTHYFLITAIMTDGAEYASCKVTAVSRAKLLVWLEKKGLTNAVLSQKDRLIRNNDEGKVSSRLLNAEKEGYFYFSKTNKSEQPINLVLRLEMLVRKGIAKELSEGEPSQ